MIQRTITIDPGFNLGFCIWTLGLKHVHESGTIKAPKKGSVEVRAGRMVDRLLKLCKEHNVFTAFIEEPAYHDTSAGQMVARRGDLVKLVFTTGMIAGAMKGSGVRILMVPIMRWKGQLPKDVTHRRAAKAMDIGYDQFCKTFETSHERDAVALGIWARGEL